MWYNMYDKARGWTNCLTTGFVIFIPKEVLTMRITNQNYNRIMALAGKYQSVKRMVDEINAEICEVCFQLLKSPEEDFGFDDIDDKE